MSESFVTPPNRVPEGMDDRSKIIKAAAPHRLVERPIGPGDELCGCNENFQCFDNSPRPIDFQSLPGPANCNCEDCSFNPTVAQELHWQSWSLGPDGYMRDSSDNPKTRGLVMPGHEYIGANDVIGNPRKIYVTSPPAKRHIPPVSDLLSAAQEASKRLNDTLYIDGPTHRSLKPGYNVFSTISNHDLPFARECVHGAILNRQAKEMTRLANELWEERRKVHEIVAALREPKPSFDPLNAHELGRSGASGIHFPEIRDGASKRKACDS